MHDALNYKLNKRQKFPFKQITIPKELCLSSANDELIFYNAIVRGTQLIALFSLG
jgi:hypothetical protein